MFKNINILGVKINNLTKIEFLEEIRMFIYKNAKGYITTVNAEFINLAQKDDIFLKIINNSFISTADGVGVLLAAQYDRYKTQNFIYNLYLFSKLIVNRVFRLRLFDEVISEKLSGSEIIFDICELAAREKFTVFFLGGGKYNSTFTGDIAATKIRNLYENIKISGTFEGNHRDLYDKSIVDEINKYNPDILFVCFGAPLQEKWIARNLDKLNIHIAIGLGGTFDMIAGKQSKPHKFLTQIGLEGILRPFYAESTISNIIKRIIRSWGNIFRFIINILTEK